MASLRCVIGSCRYAPWKRDDDILRQLLEKPAALSTYIDSYVAERRRLVGDLTKRRSRAEAELAKAKAANERALKNLIYGHITTESWLLVRPELERNIALAEAELARTEAPHPAAVANYKSALDNLHDVMRRNTDDACGAFSASLRDIVHTVLVHPVETGAPIRLEVHGKFAALIGESGAITLVAGARFGQNCNDMEQDVHSFGCWDNMPGFMMVPAKNFGLPGAYLP